MKHRLEKKYGTPMKSGSILRVNNIPKNTFMKTYFMPLRRTTTGGPKNKLLVVKDNVGHDASRKTEHWCHRFIGYYGINKHRVVSL